MLDLFVGFDPRESAAYHVFVQSVLNRTTIPVRITPLHEPMLRFDGQQDGSNAFIYSRYLVPSMMGYEGWALFCDGDMVAQRDLADLWALRDDRYAVQVVKHDYRPASKLKYIGSPMTCPNAAYPRKNWSSVMLWNCGHPSNQTLTESVVANAGGKYLHRFEWLQDSEIGELPDHWNRLVGEQVGDGSLLHYTLGVPGFSHYANCEYSQPWHATLMDALEIAGETPQRIVERAHGRRNV